MNTGFRLELTWAAHFVVHGFANYLNFRTLSFLLVAFRTRCICQPQSGIPGFGNILGVLDCGFFLHLLYNCELLLRFFFCSMG
jgi:hypothetical protein